VFLATKSVKPDLKVSMQDSTVNIDSKIMRLFSLGQFRMIASLIWVETLLNSDLEHYQSSDLKSWMFLRLNAITTLHPYFYQAYIYGGMYLSIIKDDEMGAKALYQKGLKYFPNDYYLNFNLGFHYYFELGNPEKAIEHFEKVKYHPKAPPHLPLLTARLKTLKGDLMGAYILIRENYQRAAPDSPLRKKLFHDLYAVKAEIDLKCLNSQKDNCQKKDLEGVYYLKKEDGIFIAPKPWKKFQIKKRPHQK
jgi:tetratricopeptide (TPR) repeat protein